MDQTTASFRNGTFLTPIMACTFILGVGTGGLYTPSYHAARGEKLVFTKQGEAKEASLTVADDIEYIKTCLGVTMTEIAKCLGVSRQAPYNWIAGGTIKNENISKLNNLKAAADVIASADLPRVSLLLQRKLPGGKSLLDTISHGQDGATAAMSLVEMYTNESEQRKTLGNYFAGRRPTASDVLTRDVVSSKG